MPLSHLKLKESLKQFHSGFTSNPIAPKSITKLQGDHHTTLQTRQMHAMHSRVTQKNPLTSELKSHHHQYCRWTQTAPIHRRLKLRQHLQRGLPIQQPKATHWRAKQQHLFQSKVHLSMQSLNQIPSTANLATELFSVTISNSQTNPASTSQTTRDHCFSQRMDTGLSLAMWADSVDFAQSACATDHLSITVPQDIEPSLLFTP